MYRLTGLFALSFSLLISGCLQMGASGSSGSNNAIDSVNRPSTGSEPIIGYIVNPNAIRVSYSPAQSEYNLQAPPHTVTVATGEKPGTFVSVHEPLWYQILSFFDSTSHYASLQGDYLAGRYAEPNGSFSVRFRYTRTPPPYLFVGLQQEAGSEAIEVFDRDNLAKPTWTLLLRNELDQSYVTFPVWVSEGLENKAREVERFCEAYPAICSLALKYAPPSKTVSLPTRR